MTPVDALGERPDLVSKESALAYERWLDTEATDDAYLYTDQRVRFDARDDDIVVAAPGLSAEDTAGGTRLEAPSLGSELELEGVSSEAVRRLLALFDGNRTLAEAKRMAGLSEDAATKLVRAAFGIVLFSPLAVAELEHAVPAAEIVRFPGSPYEIPRNYWQNMASVRRLAPRLFERAKDPLAALDELRRLHVVTLLGENESSFYRPASPIAKKGIAPGNLWLRASRTVETESGTRFAEGPRVGARFLGGDLYGALLGELAGDAGAASVPLHHRDEMGLDWGRVIIARADGDDEAAPWFCPPRPLTVRHVQSLFESLARARADTNERSGDGAVRHLAAFHQQLVRLHPFRAANQSLAMSIVNAVLAGEGRGEKSELGGVPHLILDHLAHRLLPVPYENVFALAAREWRASGSPAEKLRLYGDRKRRSFALVKRMQGAGDAEEARAIARAAASDARLALLLLPD